MKKRNLFSICLLLVIAVSISFGESKKEEIYLNKSIRVILPWVPGEGNGAVLGRSTATGKKELLIAAIVFAQDIIIQIAPVHSDRGYKSETTLLDNHVKLLL